MNYTIEQLRLAYERGAEIEIEIPPWGWKRETKFSLGFTIPPGSYRLANPQKDAHLTRFDLYPFDLERALAGEALITRDGREALLSDEDGRVFKIDGVDYGFQSYGGFSDEESRFDLFMRFAPQVDQHLKPNKQKLEPWKRILLLYGRAVPHAEYTAKWEAGFELEYLDPNNDGEWLDVDASPSVFFDNVQFREKQTPKKFQSWRYDYIGVRNGIVYCESFNTREECEKEEQLHDESAHGKIVRGCYLVEYEL